MKKLGMFLGSLVISFAVLSLGFVQTANAQDTKGKWSMGIRGGISVYTSDDIDSGDVGPAVSGVLMYGVTEWLDLGLNTEWDTHDTDVGDIQTVSLLPTVQLRTRYQALSPYALLGLGINFNSFDRDNSIKPFNVSVDDSFALKVGVGADYFFTPNFAFNTELGWKYSEPDADLKLGGSKIAGEEFDASAFSALFGFRYYF